MIEKLRLHKTYFVRWSEFGIDHFIKGELVYFNKHMIIIRKIVKGNVCGYSEKRIIPVENIFSISISEK